MTQETLSDVKSPAKKLRLNTQALGLRPLDVVEIFQTATIRKSDIGCIFMRKGDPLDVLMMEAGLNPFKPVPDGKKEPTYPIIELYAMLMFHAMIGKIQNRLTKYGKVSYRRNYTEMASALYTAANMQKILAFPKKYSSILINEADYLEGLNPKFRLKVMMRFIMTFGNRLVRDDYRPIKRMFKFGCMTSRSHKLPVSLVQIYCVLDYIRYTAMKCGTMHRRDIVKCTKLGPSHTKKVDNCLGVKYPKLDLNREDCKKVWSCLNLDW